MRSQRRCIKINPISVIHYLVDANVLVNKYLNLEWITDEKEKNIVKCCQDYWKVIDNQVLNEKAKVFVLDICIAEVFKTLSKKYYKNYFPNASSYSWVCRKIRRDISLSYKNAKKSDRKIKFHDIQLNRDIIIGVDRFFEKIHKKKNCTVNIVDVSILSTAKYLVDFFSFNDENLVIITADKDLYDIGKQYRNMPSLFFPSCHADRANKVFV